VDPQYLQDQTALCVVQVNGKLRGKWLFPRDQTEEEVLAFIKAQPQICKHVTGSIKKVVYIPNKLINLVVE
jgi:leucyl-tRNA synthetase